MAQRCLHHTTSAQLSCWPVPQPTVLRGTRTHRRHAQPHQLQQPLPGVAAGIQCRCSTSPAAPVGQQQASRVVVEVPSENAMAALGARMACSLRRGDVYLLHGEVGAGKSVFSRAFVRAALGDESLPVPSPTFLLVNTYELEAEEQEVQAVHHYDLYRLQQRSSNPAGSFERLGIRETFASDVCLVEWPERLPAQLQPAEFLSVHISIVHGSLSGQQQQGEAPQDGEEVDPFSDQRARQVTLHATGQRWVERLGELLHAIGDEGCGLHVVSRH